MSISDLIGDCFEKCILTCKGIFHQTISTEANEHQKKTKAFISKGLEIVGNVFFVFIVVLFIIWIGGIVINLIAPVIRSISDFVMPYVQIIKRVLPEGLIVAILLKCINILSVVVGIAVGVILLLLLLIYGLLMLYKWVKFTDILKVYFVIEGILLVVNFSNSSIAGQRLILTRMVDHALGTSIISKLGSANSAKEQSQLFAAPEQKAKTLPVSNLTTGSTGSTCGVVKRNSRIFYTTQKTVPLKSVSINNIGTTYTTVDTGRYVLLKPADISALSLIPAKKNE